MLTGDNFSIIFNFSKQVASRKLAKIQFTAQPEDESATFSLTSEILMAVGEAVLLCIFGPDIVSGDKYLMVNQWTDGEKKPVPLAIAFQNTFSQSH